MPVYVIRAGDTEFVKIGWAESVPARIRELQAGNHLTLNILRSIDGGRTVEAWLHRHFKAFCIEREWFRFTPEMLEIEPPQFASPPNVDSPARKILGLFDSHSALARTLGKPHTTVTQWALRGKIPSWHWVPIMEAAAKLTPPVHLRLEHFFGGKPLPEPERAP